MTGGVSLWDDGGAKYQPIKTKEMSKMWTHTYAVVQILPASFHSPTRIH